MRCWGLVSIGVGFLGSDHSPMLLELFDEIDSEKGVVILERGNEVDVQKEKMLEKIDGRIDGLVRGEEGSLDVGLSKVDSVAGV